ncbi:hypothetical protein AGIG_G13696 [Arapaima gigas]
MVTGRRALFRKQCGCWTASSHERQCESPAAETSTPHGDFLAHRSTFLLVTVPAWSRCPYHDNMSDNESGLR